MNYQHELWKAWNKEKERLDATLVLRGILMFFWILVLGVIVIIFIVHWYINDDNTFMQVLKWTFSNIWFFWLYAVGLPLLFPSTKRKMEEAKELENKLSELTAIKLYEQNDKQRKV